jgi:hypothetical protein
MREKKPGAPGERGGPLFELGQVVGTPGALQALTEAGQLPAEFLARHVTGDWESLRDEGKEENELSVEPERQPDTRRVTDSDPSTTD